MCLVFRWRNFQYSPNSPSLNGAISISANFWVCTKQHMRFRSAAKIQCVFSNWIFVCKLLTLSTTSLWKFWGLWVAFRTCFVFRDAIIIQNQIKQTQQVNIPSKGECVTVKMVLRSKPNENVSNVRNASCPKRYTRRESITETNTNAPNGKTSGKIKVWSFWKCKVNEMGLNPSARTKFWQLFEQLKTDFFANKKNPKGACLTSLLFRADISS